jgi:hypothetical protein
MPTQYTAFPLSLRVFFVLLFARQMDLALQALRRLHIVEQEANNELSLNANFRKSLKRALTGGCVLRRIS